MKFGVGQVVSLLTTEGQPAAGKSVIKSVNHFNQTYTVDFYRANSQPETITDIPEGRLVALTSINEMFDNKKKSLKIVFSFCMSAKLFVGGFPLNITELELAHLIAPHGDIDTIKIVRDKKTNLCKGYAFVEMKLREGAEDAVTILNGFDYKGGKLNLSICETPEPVAITEKPISQRSYERVSPKPTAFANFSKPKRPRRPSI